jgi:ABC-2 type transport system permease protein
VETVKNQYRRTVLGPWWLTLQTALYVVGLSLVFSQLLGSGLRNFLPYVALGFITFAFLQGLVRAGAQVFVNAAGAMKSTRQPLTTFVLRDVLVEGIQFLHNMVIPLSFYAVGLLDVSWAALLVVPVLIVIAVNGVLISLWLGPAVARFRDIGPAVTSVLQVLIFFTPVFYRPEDLSGSRATLLNLNPFTYFVQAFRAPLLGYVPASGTWLGVAAISAANLVLAVLVFARTRSRLPYWVA